jgi:hypothetical protein
MLFGCTTHAVPNIGSSLHPFAFQQLNHHPAPSFTPQLEARGTKERARLGWPFFGPEVCILKTMMFRDVTTVLNERKHLKMEIRSFPDAVNLFLGRTEWLGLTTLHRA